MAAPAAALHLAYIPPAIVGRTVRASAQGLPAGKTVQLMWGTVTGGWVIEDYYHFRGKKYSESKTELGRFVVDSGGRLDAAFAIPEDYGGVHEVMALIDGKPAAQNGINVSQSFEMSPSSGPVGTPIEIKVTGLGWRTMESTWVVNWDNHELGWISAAGTRGSAVARFRSAGPAGDHMIKLYTGWQGQAYLNYEQSPVADLPRPEFTFQTTGAKAAVERAFAESYALQVLPKTEVKVRGATLGVAPTQGPVGTRVLLRGQRLPANSTLTLVWETAAGSRVTDAGFDRQDKEIGSVVVSKEGTLETPLTIPDDLGGLHGLTLQQGDDVVARAYFVIETSVLGMTPTSGPVGTPVSIHLKGVGWTEYDNIYVATYDNAYMGYACGFNSHGDVVINFIASGDPGEHVIDLYPGIYQGPPTEPQQLYRLPQLTYADDHPGNKIPALRFTFEVTRSRPTAAH
jgi:hypothetical protein